MHVQPISRKSFYNKITKLLYLTIPFFISISLLFIGCECKDNSPPNSPPKVASNATGSTPSAFSTDATPCSDSSSGVDATLLTGASSFHVSKNGSTANTNPNVVTNQPPIFFLAHGWNDTPDRFDSFQKKLLEKFPDSKVILSSSVTQEETFSLSIEQQAKKCHTEFLKRTSTIPNAKERPIILIGHSQGGLRVSALAPKLQEAGYKVKIVGINTPFEGVPLLRFKDCASLLQHVKTYVEQKGEAGQQACYLIDRLITALNSSDPKALSSFLQFLQPPGLQDLVEGSAALRDIHAKLVKLNIPKLAIGGVYSNLLSELLNKFINKEKNKLSAETDDILDQFLDFSQFIEGLLTPLLDNLYTNLIVGKENVDQSHDGFVPLYSQLGSATLEKSPNYHQVTIHNTAHISIDDFGIIGTLDSPEALDEIQKFVER
ncbi:DUF3089 domain-containing protein [Candidatus Cardinium hertigii]|uniref:DUF3089 domain-containing protein n=1 Tax=Candidatus Cardinium hertigii TaxID=247481 RepID=UPI001FAB1853|nr:DUF3089 domain-containing protein [Candidatus Cardinium hertigii]